MKKPSQYSDEQLLKKLGITTKFKKDFRHTVIVSGTDKAELLLEFYHRMNACYFNNLSVFMSPHQFFEYVISQLRDSLYEKMIMYCVDSKGKIKAEYTIAEGAVNYTAVHIPKIIRYACIEACNSIVLAHVHPSGDPTPSKEDILITKNMIKIFKSIGIEFWDHLIVGNGSYISFSEQFPAMWEESGIYIS